MIAEAALAAAGPDAHLAHRPAGVLHVYVGPTTPAGYVPRRNRPVCRAYTRQLRTIPQSERRSSLDPQPVPRVCARCSARLSSCKGVNARRAEPVCVHRDDFRRRYADLTRRDLWAQVVMAETVQELDAIAHLSLILLGHAVCEQPLPVSHEGYRAPSLTRLIGETRERLADYPNRDRGEALTALVETGYAQAKASRKATWQEREDRIKRLGFVAATR